MNTTRVRQLLKGFDFQPLFIEELGWDNHTQELVVPVDGSEWALTAIAEKRGMVAFRCSTPPGTTLPEHQVRRKIERQVAKSVHEHFIIFTDSDESTQIWQWIKRESGNPAASREHTFHANTQQGEALIQKLQAIAFSLDEEENLTLVDVVGRTKTSFDVEHVTKRFYDQFKKEHSAFLKFIAGITEGTDREWYASVMLNRLMFVYFIQKKGFLDGDPNYLRNRLNKMRADHGRDKFHSFYRYFLLRLFHEGLGGTKRTKELEDLLGRIPYLNGGLFDIHELERSDRYGDDIRIPDEAFERIFGYFDNYEWHLDDRPLKKDDEINPDVLGYIFEKYINQKQMGAYYTKEDITEYISKSTIIPYLIDSAHKECKVAFENPGGPTVWDYLRDDPDRYIYPAIRHGITWNYQPTHPEQGEPLDDSYELPEEIQKGVNPPTLHDPVGDVPIQTLELRKGWNRAAPAKYALPTETWREVVERRSRYEEVRSKLASGEVRDINDLITLNLDIRQFAQDVIENAEGPELLRAMWHAVEKVTVLDPTCGSGAFLFAALNILEPLYQACLDRMEAFIEDLDRSEEKVHPERFSDFRKVLKNVDAHPNRDYFVLKSIILNNLYGVDIMEEAVEICKLRLFLKLAAQVDPDRHHSNIGIEPLPDIDFNIRAGNTLVGFATYEEAESAVKAQFDFDDSWRKISTAAADLHLAFDMFRARQIEGDGSVPTGDKQRLRRRLLDLDEELNSYLASQYGVDLEDRRQYEQWVATHKPFHWFSEFHRIMDEGGFCVVIGNPPFIEIPRELNRNLLRDTFSTVLEKWSRDEDVYTLVVERSLMLADAREGNFGMILPLSVTFSTKRPFLSLRNLLQESAGQWLLSHYDRIPSALFGNEVRTRCTIAVHSRSRRIKNCQIATTPLLRWNAEFRSCLFATSHHAQIDFDINPGIAKVGSQVQADSLAALLSFKTPLGRDLSNSISFKTLADSAPDFPQPCVFVGGTAYNWFPSWRDIPETTNLRGEPSLPARTAGYRFTDEDTANIVFALLCSSLGYWWWSVASDGFNLKKWLLNRFPVSTATIPIQVKGKLATLGAELRKELCRHYVYKDNRGRIGNYFLPACEEQILAIDTLLAESLTGLAPSFFEDIRKSNASFSRVELGDSDRDLAE